MEDEDDKPPKTTTILTTLILLLSSFAFAYADDDTTVMLDLSRGFDTPPPGWSGTNPCKWQAISCDSSGRITSINLSSKSISGTLPSTLPKLSKLVTLSLQHNRLSGRVPSLADMSELTEVYLDGNFFTQIDTPFLSNLPNLQSFSIDDNPLDRWTIPNTLSNSSSLQEFHAANSSLVGSIPDIFGSLPSLKDLRLSYNDLTGTLPSSFAGSLIQNLWLNNQLRGLSGELHVLEKMTSLSQVWLQANAFTGPIPDLSKCVSLFDLQLRDNHLTGVVPPSLTNLPKLVNVSLQNNKLQGPTPSFKSGVKVTLGTTNSFCLATPGTPCDTEVSILLEIISEFGYPAVLADSWKGNNACNNWVHVSCNSDGKVTVVNFAKQGWRGLISPAFANLTSVTTIILSDNNLVGRIPDVLTTLKSLEKLDLTNNNLTGQIPKFGGSVIVLTYGNTFIGTDVDTANNATSSSSSGGRVSKLKVCLITIGVLIMVVVLGFIVYKIVMRNKVKKYGQVEISKKKGKGKSNNKIEDLKTNSIDQVQESPTEASSMLNNIHSFFDHGSLIPIDVLREVTDNFSDANILGRGGFGIVYKGVLRDGTQVAIKRMEGNVVPSTKGGGMSEFEAEIAVLSKVRHRHLVALLGHCVTKSERIVVYEYMPQGTLGQHLFECVERGFTPLTWKQRLVIALDVAKGVEYLHSLAQQSFIHRDLKPSNILLGDNMRAKVSDFGLVKNAPDQGKYSVETRLAGTFGYLAPEYAATGRVTTKVDVFAFGVVLMELITGRKALDENLPDDEAQLVNWFRRVLINREGLRKTLDPRLQINENDEEMYDSITKVAELSGHCTVREPHQRPDMSHAVNVLSPLVNQWRPTHELDCDDGMGFDVNMSLPQALQRWQAGETTTMSGYSVNQTSRGLRSTDTSSSAIDQTYTHIRGR